MFVIQKKEEEEEIGTPTIINIFKARTTRTKISHYNNKNFIFTNFVVSTQQLNAES